VNVNPNEVTHPRHSMCGARGQYGACWCWWVDPDARQSVVKTLRDAAVVAVQGLPHCVLDFSSSPSPSPSPSLPPHHHLHLHLHLHLHYPAARYRYGWVASEQGEALARGWGHDGEVESALVRLPAPHQVRRRVETTCVTHPQQPQTQRQRHGPRELLRAASG